MDTDNPTYPTRSLHFLERLKGHILQKSEETERARVPLNIVITGAGIGGLSTAIALARRGHHVTEFEQVQALSEVGAGLQIPSNASRLLLRWGVGPYLHGRVVEPASISFRRWKTGEVIGHTRLVPEFQQTFDAPYYVVHRADYLQALRQRAVDLGVDVRTGCKVVDFDFDTPSVTLLDGSKHAADLVVAVEGVKSIARTKILDGQDVPPTLAGFAAYRATVPACKMLADPDTAWLVEKATLNCWIGHMRHVMSYTIAGGKSFNMVLSHPETTNPDTWRQERAVEDMRQQFQGWDHRLVKVINMIDRTLKWPLLSGVPLARWVSTSGKVLITGDAAHPMLPYMSEGAAMAVEDGAALAEVLSCIESKDQLATAARVFEKERIKRTSQMQQASAINGKLWHFADGPEQEARDEAMRPEVDGRHFSESPNQWSDPVTANWCYGYDAEKEMARAWEQHVFFESYVV